MDKNKCDLDVMINLYKMPIDGNWRKTIVAYHITLTENLQSILQNGLKSNLCIATRDNNYRASAVYLFAYKCDAFDNNIRKFLFGNQKDLTILKITIPDSYYEKLKYDGLFNMSCKCEDDTYSTAIYFRDNIPVNWIEIIS
jgi:hypothetical protein